MRGVFSISCRTVMDVQTLDKAAPFTTKDGSQIRELLAHRNSCILNQSLAEARVAPGATTVLHYHCRSEEIYYVLAGRGRMRLGQEIARDRTWRRRCHSAGRSAPNHQHRLRSAGFSMLLRTGYEHDDTVLVD